MPNAPIPDYDQLTDRLSQSPLQPSASEAHGVLCALFCAGFPAASDAWVDELFVASNGEGVPDAETRQAMRALAEQTHEEICGPGLRFSPLLPSEERPLRERALALYDWVRGFVYGLGVAGVRQEELSAEGREVLDDFTNITRMDLDALEEGEENERSLTELQEFVWVAAMLVYEERGRAAGGPDVEG